MNSPAGLRDLTLMFLVKRSGEGVSHVCLAMKKRGFGANRWNGVGGKLESGETVEEAARREAFEEVGIKAGKLTKTGELLFYFVPNPAWDQRVHVYLCEEWDNEPVESEEMAPKWHALHEIPFESMWPDDKHWLPHVLDGKYVNAAFFFGEGDDILDHEVIIGSTT